MAGGNGIGERTVRKVSRRLLPFLFILYVVAFLDRVNFRYAALDMNSALGISAELFGFLSGIFFIGYLLFEVPANMILQRIGARIWISRIILSWGIIVIITAAATSASERFVFRFLLGVAEAGFFPGIIPYITCWFRREDLARTLALFMIALAVSNIIGAPVSTGILENIHWFGIAGWRWLFVLEGLPALVLGVVTWFWLTNRPEEAAGPGIRLSKRGPCGNRGTPLPANVNPAQSYAHGSSGKVDQSGLRPGLAQVRCRYIDYRCSNDILPGRQNFSRRGDNAGNFCRLDNLQVFSGIFNNEYE